MQYINELRDGEMIKEIYLCKQKQNLQTKAGKSYYSLILQDKTGTIDAKVWDLNNGIGHFEPMDYIEVNAQVILYQGSPQLNVRQIRKADEGEYDVSDYMPCSPFDTEQMYQELLALIASVKETHLHQLLESFFVNDSAFIQSFKKHSAAKSIHHGFIGGLLQHTLAVTRLCDYMASQYPVIHRDLLITAAICHDIGKIYEISDFPENDYTDEGQLIGHIVKGTMMVEEKIHSIDGFPEKLGNELKHCILAHHGELEFGSPKKPSLIEAVALSFADNTDAKLQTFTETLNSTANTDWLGYNRLFESNIRATSKPE